MTHKLVLCTFYVVICVYQCSCSFYNGRYCSSYFNNDIMLNMSNNHDMLIMQHLTQLKVVNHEIIISDACYSNLLAVLCYSTVEVCQNSFNTLVQLCSDDCLNLHSALVQECPHFIHTDFQQTTGLQCGNNLMQDCFSVANVTTGILD